MPCCWPIGTGSLDNCKDYNSAFRGKHHNSRCLCSYCFRSKRHSEVSICEKHNGITVLAKIVNCETQTFVRYLNGLKNIINITNFVFQLFILDILDIFISLPNGGRISLIYVLYISKKAFVPHDAVIFYGIPPTTSMITFHASL